MPLVENGASGGGGSIPSGAGSPIGSIVPSNKGALYVDSAAGALYVAVGVTNADWVVVGGIQAGEAIGISQDGAGGTLHIVGPAGNNVGASLTDAAAKAGTGNALFWQPGAADGQQALNLFIGSTGQYEHDWNPNGTYTAGNGIIFPSADPHIVGAWWDNGVTLMRSAG